MSAPTPGQQAHAGYMVDDTFVGDDIANGIWDRMSDTGRQRWEAAAQAVLNGAFPGLREQVRLARQDRDQLRKHVLDLAASLENSAAATAPSKKSGIENDLAAKLRQVAEPPS